MWKNIGVVLVILGIAFGWLKSHDSEVRFKALAKARRDSLEAAWVTRDSAISVYQDSIKQWGDTIGKTIVKIKIKRDTVDLRSVEDSSRIEYLKQQVGVQKKKSDSISVALVDSMTDAYELRMIDYRNQIFIANRLTQLAQDSTKLMTNLYNSEIDRNKNLAKFNTRLKKDLDNASPHSLGHELIHYILPTVAVTYGIVKLSENRNSKGTN